LGGVDGTQVFIVASFMMSGLRGRQDPVDFAGIFCSQSPSFRVLICVQEGG